MEGSRFKEVSPKGRVKLNNRPSQKPTSLLLFLICHLELNAGVGREGGSPINVHCIFNQTLRSKCAKWTFLSCFSQKLVRIWSHNITL